MPQVQVSGDTNKVVCSEKRPWFLLLLPGDTKCSGLDEGVLAQVFAPVGFE